MLIEVVLALVFAGVFFFVLGMGSLLTVRRSPEIIRLMGGLPDDHSLRKNRGVTGFLDRAQTEASQAGLSVTTAQLALIAFMAGAGGFALLWAVTGKAHLALLGMGAGLYAPGWWVAKSRIARARMFASQLEDALERISAMLRAGSGIIQALERATEDLGDPAGKELRMIVNQARLMPLVDALRRACQRVHSPELELVTAAIDLTQRCGGNLASVLEGVVDSMRARRNFREKVSALTAESRISANVLIGITLGLLGMLRVSSPEFVAPLYTTPTGLALAGISAVLMLVGWKMVSRVANIKSD